MSSHGASSGPSAAGGEPESQKSRPQEEHKHEHNQKPDGAHPPWNQPSPDSATVTGLMVHNSLTSTKVPFIPQKGNTVHWYACGPTVYSSSHLGHARAYITFDIIRRILEDYFQYDLNLTMNITDVDDKIILRARRNYLFEEYEKEAAGKDIQSVVDDIEKSFSLALQKAKSSVQKIENDIQTAKNKKQKANLEEQLKGEMFKLGDIESHYEKFQKTERSDETRGEMLKTAADVISAYLDKLKGADVNDHSIYKKHAQTYELEFFEDLKILNIRDVDVITRVTEYIPQIIAYIEKIVQNGYAYVSNNSVYFDIAEFAKDHDYARLRPAQVGNLSALAEGEGALIGSGSEKRNTIDFALWKASKAGEPWWDSPWGKGRPGWHIECSAMASDTLGETMDIHSGGIDLCFPHHDNEMAQAEAHYSVDGKPHQWVNYFLHAGHLGVEGLKMSRSLKNFFTIREILEKHSARTIRLAFLKSAWDKEFNYTEQGLNEAKNLERDIKNYFLSIKSAIHRNGEVGTSTQGWVEEDRKMNDEIINIQSEIRKALCDNFDYPKVIDLLQDLMTNTNSYMMNDSTKSPLLRKSGDLVTKMFKIFGVFDNEDFGDETQSGVDSFESLAPILDQLCRYRDAIREGGRSKKINYDYFTDQSRQTVEQLQLNVPGFSEEKSSWILEPGSVSAQGVTDVYELDILQAITNAQFKRKQNILKAYFKFYTTVLGGVQDKKDKKYFMGACDIIRDEDLVDLGVRMEDSKRGSVWKLDDPGLLNAERNEKRDKAMANEMRSARNRLKEAEKEYVKFSEASLSAQEYYSKTLNTTFSQFDGKGVPTHDEEGAELSKASKKKIAKVSKGKQKLDKWLQKKLKQDENYSETLQERIGELNVRLEELKTKVDSFK